MHTRIFNYFEILTQMQGLSLEKWIWLQKQDWQIFDIKTKTVLDGQDVYREEYSQKLNVAISVNVNAQTLELCNIQLSVQVRTWYAGAWNLTFPR